MEFGSAADWVTGLLTAGTLIMTVRIAARQQMELDRRQRERQAAVVRSLDWLELRQAELQRVYYYELQDYDRAMRWLNLPEVPGFNRIEESLLQLPSEELPATTDIDRLNRLKQRIYRSVESLNRVQQMPGITDAVRIERLREAWAVEYRDAREVTERLQPILRPEGR